VGNASARLDPERLLAESSWVRALAQSLVGPSDVDDVVQETWRIALERPPRVGDSNSNLRGWLATVMRNLVQRSRRGERMRVDHAERVHRELTSSESDAHERVLLQRHLADVVLQLDEPYKSAIVARYFDGLSPREIAAEQHISYDAARQRLSRGLAILRARLDRDYGGGRATWSALCLALVRRKAALANPAVVVGGIVVSVKSVLGVAAALVLVVASAWWLRGSSAGPANASASAAPPVPELAPRASEAPNEDLRVVASDANAGDRVSDIVAPEADDEQVAVADQDAFEPRLDAIAATFLTEQPDFRGLAALWDEIAAGAALVPDSVSQDGKSVSGELSIPGSSIRAKFDISNDRYRVSLDKTRVKGSESPYVVRSLTLAFQNKSGLVVPSGSTVQFHPDLNRTNSAEFQGVLDRPLGWTMFLRDGHVQAVPLDVRSSPDGPGWRIGQSPSRPTVEAIYGLDGRAEQALFNLLAKQALSR